MQKSIYRKYAISTLSLLVVGMLAACSGASSTDEELAYERNMIGTVQFDVNTSAQSVTVTPVGSPWSSNQLAGDTFGNIPNVAITTSNVSYVGTTMDFDATVKWLDVASDLWNVRLEIASTTDGDVVNAKDDRCTGATPWTTCLAGANKPTVTYVSDITSEGPETKTQTNGIGQTNTFYKTTIHARCGQVTAHWKLTESSGLGYKFWAKLYGDPAPVDPLADPRYDQYTATLFNRVRKLTYATTNNPGEGADASQMAVNEWFYVHVYVDYPGNNQNVAYGYYDMDVNGFYEALKHVEDQQNVAAYGSTAVNSSANYWYVGGWLPYSVRFDTAVVETASNEANAVPPIMTGTKFNTAKATRIVMPFDSTPATVDGFNAGVDVFTSSNRMGIIKGVGANFAATAVPAFYPNPCNNRANGTGCPAGVRDGYANRDLDIARVAMHIKSTAVAGQGSYIVPSSDLSYVLAGYSTEGTPYNGGDDAAGGIKPSANWPSYCEAMPGSGCWVTAAGHFNIERAFVCVQ